MSSEPKEQATPEFEKELAKINKEIEEKGMPDEDEFAAFGGLDFDDVPESILRGKYACELVAARLHDVTKEEYDVKLGKKVWILDFTVSRDMKYMGESTSMFLNLYTSPDLHTDPITRQTMLGEELIEPKEQQQIRDAMKFYRRVAEELGFSKEDIKRGVNFKKKEGKEYMLSLYADNNKKTRISQGDPITSVEETDSVSTLDSLQNI